MREVRELRARIREQAAEIERLTTELGRLSFVCGALRAEIEYGKGVSSVPLAKAVVEAARTHEAEHDSPDRCGVCLAVRALHAKGAGDG